MRRSIHCVIPKLTEVPHFRLVMLFIGDIPMYERCKLQFKQDGATIHKAHISMQTFKKDVFQICGIEKYP